jgi:nucleoid DNA-binding protein
MKKPEIARRLARQSGITKAAAADELDRVVHRILVNLRKGRDTAIRGLGIFVPGPGGAPVLHPEKDASDERR